MYRELDVLGGYLSKQFLRLYNKERLTNDEFVVIEDCISAIGKLGYMKSFGSYKEEYDRLRKQHDLRFRNEITIEEIKKRYNL